MRNSVLLASEKALFVYEDNARYKNVTVLLCHQAVAVLQLRFLRVVENDGRGVFLAGWPRFSIVMVCIGPSIMTHQQVLQLLVSISCGW